MSNLSPAVQAVLKAACIHHGLFNEEIVQRRRMVAAALRAAVDEVLPLYVCSLGSTRGTTRLGVRQKLLAIAAELEAQ